MIKICTKCNRPVCQYPDGHDDVFCQEHREEFDREQAIADKDAARQRREYLRCGWDYFNYED